GSWLPLLAKVLSDYATRSPWFLRLSLRRQRRLAGPVLQELARDHDLLHLGRAFIDTQCTDLPIELLDLDALGDAGAAVQLHGTVDHALRRLGRIHLRHRRLAGDARRALVLAPGGTIDEQRRGVDLARAVGDRRLCQLQRAARAAQHFSARPPPHPLVQPPPPSTPPPTTP